MKKLLTILFTLVSAICFSQTRPIQPMGTKVNEVKMLGALSIDTALFVTPYATLAAANITGQYARTRGGSLIFVKNENALYVRNDAATSWIKLAVLSDITGSSITINGTTIAIGGSGTLVLASANFANQGTTTTVLHGNAAGNPVWGAVNLANDVTGRLLLSNLQQFPAHTVAINGTASVGDLTGLVVSASQLVGRGTTGSVANIALGTGLSMSGATLNSTALLTEVDGSVTNELQTLASTSNATSHTVTLSSTGGSIQFVEGTGITLATTGTGLNGIVTISSAGTLTLAPVGTTPNVNAASVTGMQLNLEPATVSFPGVVTIAAQTFAGIKTFTSGLESINGVGGNTSNFRAGLQAGIGMGGGSNIAIGYQSMFTAFTGSNNIAMGERAMLSNNGTASGNIALGYSALAGAGGGSGNIAMGTYAGASIGAGSENIVMGNEVGVAFTGVGNILLGARAYRNTNASITGSVIIGHEAGYYGTGGSGNVFLGYQSGIINTGSANVFVGSGAGGNETGSNRLYIEPSASATPLIYGEFDNDLVRVNGSLHITNATYVGTAPVSVNNHTLSQDANGLWLNAQVGAPGIMLTTGHNYNNTVKVTSSSQLCINCPFSTVMTAGTRLFVGDGLSEFWISTPTAWDITNHIRLGLWTYNPPSPGLGSGIEFGANQAQAANQKLMGQISVPYSDVTLGSEDADFMVKLMENGAAYAEKFRVLSTGEIKAQLLNNDNTEAKIVTWNSTNKLFEYRDASSMGGISLAPIGSTPNANAATYSAGILNVEPASTAFGGVVTTGAQSFAGNKIFRGGLESYSTAIDGTNFQAGGGGIASGQYSVVIGAGAGGYGSTGANVFIGGLAGYTSVGTGNTFLGYSAGRENAGSNNVVLGNQAAWYGSGTDNIVIGTTSGYYAGGSGNIYLGAGAGRETYSGGGNVFIGASSGWYNNGTNSVFIGSGAGYNQAGSNRLVIGNSSGNQLIYGEFDNGLVKVNGQLQVTTSTYENAAIFSGIAGSNYGGILVNSNSVTYTAYATNNVAKWRIHTFDQIGYVGDGSTDFFINNLQTGMLSMYIDGATDNVGIGSTYPNIYASHPPGRQLDIFERNMGDAQSVPALRLTSSSSVSGVIGNGTGMEIALSTDDPYISKPASYLETRWTAVAGGLHSADFVVNLVQGGAAYAEKMRVVSTGELKVQLLNQDDAEAKVVVWNSTDKIFEWRAASTLTGGAGGGYTNMTEFLTQTPYRLFYSDVNGDVQELPHGTSGQVLTSNGASANPSWAAAGGGGGYTTLSQFIGEPAWRMYYSDAAGDMTALALGTVGQVLQSNGAALAPTWITPTTGISDVVFTNGLTESPTNTGMLGGNLTSNVTITTGASFMLQISGSSSSPSIVPLFAMNTAGGKGAELASIGGIGAAIATVSGTTNAVQYALVVSSSTTGTAADGLGAAIKFRTEAAGLETGDDGTTANVLISKWTSVASRTSQFIIQGKNSNVLADLVTLEGTGALQLNKYGINTFAGTPAFALGVTASGSVVEFAVGGGGNIIDNLQATLDAGSVLTSSETIDAGTNFLGITGTGSTTNVIVQHMSGSGIGMGVFNYGTGTAIHGEASGGGVGVNARVSNATTTTLTAIMDVTLISTGVPANGIGGYIRFVNPTTTNNGSEAARIVAKRIDVNVGSLDDDLEFWSQRNAVMTKQVAFPSTGSIYVDAMAQDDAETKVVVWNSTDKIFEWRASSTLGGGAGGENFQQTLDIGSVLTSSELIQTGTNTLQVSASSGGNPTMQIDHTSGAGTALIGINSGTGVALEGRTSGGNNAITARVDITSPSTLTDVMHVTVTTSATPTAGIGGYIAFVNPSASGASTFAGRLAVKRSTFGATADDDMEFWTSRGGTMTKQGAFTSAGGLYVDVLANDDTETKVVVWNSTAKIFEYREASTLGGGSSGLVVGTTTVGSATDNYILYNDNGTLGQYAVTGSGNTAVLSIDPNFPSAISIGTTGVSGGAAQFFGTTSGAVLLVSQANAGDATVVLPSTNGTLSHYIETSIVSGATFSPSGSARENWYDVTLLAAAVTTINAPSGTVANHNTLTIRIKGDGTARAIAGWNAIYRAGTNLAFPTTTTISKTMYIKFIHNSTDNKWDLVSVIDGL